MTGRDEAQGGLAETLQHGRGVVLSVQSLGKRLAHLHLVKRRLPGIKGEKDGKATRHAHHFLLQHRILLGDRVDVELSPYDLTKGRIVFRQK